MVIRLVISWMVGIVAAHLLHLPLPWLWGGACGLLALGLRLHTHVRMRVWAWIGLAALLGALRYEASLPIFGPQSLVSLVEQGELSLRGVITEEPRRSEEAQRLVLAVETVDIGKNRRPAEGLLLLVVPPYPAYSYGQRLEVRGLLSYPRGAERPGQFDYRAYLAHRGIFVLMQQPAAVQRLPGERGIAPLAMLLSLRQHCQELLLRSLPEPQAALAVGILLGIQSSIPDEVYSAFSATGTSHILVVSGWNFTLVASVLAGLSTRMRLGQMYTLLLALSVMWIYALFTGASAAVLRAAAMASLAAVGRAAERGSEPWRLLFGGCWLISLANPHTLWDLGFQLSALATGSLFAFARPIESWIAVRRPFCWPVMAPITETLTATLAAQVLTMPLILYQFGNLSIIAPVANVLLVPLVPYAMATSALTLVAGLIWLPLGQGLAPLAWLILAWMSEGVRILATPRWAAVQIPPFPLWMLLATYLLIALLSWWIIRRRGGRLVER